MRSQEPGNLTELLTTILNSFTDLCQCDGGAIYTLRRDSEGMSYLMFEVMVTQSIQLQTVPQHLKDLKFSLDGPSLVGRTASEKKLFNVTTSDAPGSFSPVVDSTLKYTTHNMLSAPLITPRGDLVGVVQLLNKFPHRGRPEQGFDARDERLCSIFAGQAALAIENSLLLQEQERLLEGFVQACVTAIESRDPITSGHSNRVCDYTVGLAEAVNRVNAGPLKGIRFTTNQVREIRYAALLHDIGKISVKEEVLNKQKKLHPWELEMIKMRLKLMRSLLKQQHNVGHNGKVNDLELQKQMRSLHSAIEIITNANEPSVLPQTVTAQLEDLKHLKVLDDEGELFAALTEEERFKLSIPKGSLTTRERSEIERHVAHTFEILKMVPWSRGLEHVPEIAYKHHEKLDGSGYPCRCPSHEIPVQSRMMTICDIFDALAAKDRPYKSAVPVEKALDILQMEVKEGKLDNDLFKLFLDARIYDISQSEPRKRAA